MYFHEFHGMISVTIYRVKRHDRRKSRIDHSRELHCCDDLSKRCNDKTLRNAGINPDYDDYCKVDNDNN